MTWKTFLDREGLPVRWLHYTFIDFFFLTNNSQRVGMATFLPELQGRELKIGTLEVWQQPRRIARQPEMGSKLRVLTASSGFSRSAVQGLRGKTQKHPLWGLERVGLTINTPSS